ncbi:VOC family protein [Flindersiella endophytica]
MSRTSAKAEVEVSVEPEAAFAIFTEEIDLWWVRGPINFHDASRLVEQRIEPGVGGRVLEIYEGDQLEAGRITVWEPGRRLVVRGTVQDTETDIRFEKTGSGTRVTVEQYLLPGGDPRTVGFGWVTMLRTYVAWLDRRDTAPRTPREVGRLALFLYYDDPAAAARWLHRVFQLGDWDVDRVPDEGESPGWIEFHVGDSSVMLLPRDGAAEGARTHEPMVYVDDLRTHFAHAKAEGATIVTEIQHHGHTWYSADDCEGYRWTFSQARPTMP